MLSLLPEVQREKTELFLLYHETVLHWGISCRIDSPSPPRQLGPQPSSLSVVQFISDPTKKSFYLSLYYVPHTCFFISQLLSPRMSNTLVCTQNIRSCAVTEILFCLLHFLSQEHFTLRCFFRLRFSNPELVI